MKGGPPLTPIWSSHLFVLLRLRSVNLMCNPSLQPPPHLSPLSLSCSPPPFYLLCHIGCWVSPPPTPACRCQCHRPVNVPTSTLTTDALLLTPQRHCAAANAPTLLPIPCQCTTLNTPTLYPLSSLPFCWLLLSQPASTWLPLTTSTVAPSQ